MKHAVLYLYCFFANIFGQMRHYLVNSSGKTGMAPFCVQTKAETFTANSCASLTLLPFKMLATNAPVKESPAPTVSATSTFGVSINETSPGVNT